MRRSIIVILIGTIATLAGLATIDLLRERRCVELAGTWLSTTRRCALPTGETIGTGSALMFASGLVVAIGVGFVLYRAMLFVTGQARGSMKGG